jgi:hypothetical protein
MTFDLRTAERRDKEYDLLLRVVSAATVHVNESNGTVPASLGSLAALADAVHAHWKFQRDGQ